MNKVPTWALPTHDDDISTVKGSTPEERKRGVYSADQAPGAIPNGERVRKCLFEAGDANPVGTLGTVLGSIGPIPAGPYQGMFGYFVKWDTMPDVPVFVAGKKVEGLG